MSDVLNALRTAADALNPPRNSEEREALAMVDAAIPVVSNMLEALREIVAIRDNCPAGAEMDGHTAFIMADIAAKAVESDQ